MIPVTASLIGASFVAGMVTFLAPCTFPLIPAYLSFITGPEKPSVWKTVRNGLGFMVGFSTVFIVFGIFASAMATLVSSDIRVGITRIVGVIIVLWGLDMVGVLQGIRSRFQWYPRWKGLPAGKMWSSAVMGGMLAVGWSPCIGPILGTILTIAWNGAQIWDGVILMVTFSVGFAIPFLGVAILLALGHTNVSSWAKNTLWLQRLSGVVLIGVGWLFINNQMDQFSSWIFRYVQFFDYQRIFEWL